MHLVLRQRTYPTPTLSTPLLCFLHCPHVHGCRMAVNDCPTSCHAMPRLVKSTSPAAALQLYLLHNPTSDQPSQPNLGSYVVLSDQLLGLVLPKSNPGVFFSFSILLVGVCDLTYDFCLLGGQTTHQV
jgi:hypothetical protein